MPGPIPDSIESFQINWTDAAAERPILAIEAARIFAMWANVEFMLGAMASILIGEDSALALLDRLRSRNQKLDAIRAVSVDRIKHTDTRNLMSPLFRLINRAAEPRNQLAHCSWGTISDLPDALLLTKPEAAIKAARIISQSNGQRSTASDNVGHAALEHQASFSNEEALAVIHLLRGGTEVWRQEDFQEPRSLIGNATAALTYYTVAITGDPDADPAVRARQQLRDLLAGLEQYH